MGGTLEFHVLELRPRACHPSIFNSYPDIDCTTYVQLQMRITIFVSVTFVLDCRNLWHNTMNEYSISVRLRRGVLFIEKKITFVISQTLNVVQFDC